MALDQGKQIYQTQTIDLVAELILRVFRKAGLTKVPPAPDLPSESPFQAEDEVVEEMPDTQNEFQLLECGLSIESPAVNVLNPVNPSGDAMTLVGQGVTYLNQGKLAEAIGFLIRRAH